MPIKNFITVFDLRSSIVLTFSIAAYPVYTHKRKNTGLNATKPVYGGSDKGKLKSFSPATDRSEQIGI